MVWPARSVRRRADYAPRSVPARLARHPRVRIPRLDGGVDASPSSTGAPDAAGCNGGSITTHHGVTEFVAETLLPTTTGMRPGNLAIRFFSQTTTFSDFRLFSIPGRPRNEPV